MASSEQQKNNLNRVLNSRSYFVVKTVRNQERVEPLNFVDIFYVLQQTLIIF